MILRKTLHVYPPANKQYYSERELSVEHSSYNFYSESQKEKAMCRKGRLSPAIYLCFTLEWGEHQSLPLSIHRIH